MNSNRMRIAASPPSQTSACAAGFPAGPVDEMHKRHRCSTDQQADRKCHRLHQAQARPGTPVRIADLSCCSREKSAGATVLIGIEKMVSGQPERLNASA